MPWIREFAILTAFGAALAATGCGSSLGPGSVGATTGRTLPVWMGGEPAGTPARPQALPAYPAVHDMPPDREKKLITVEEQTKVEAELSTLRAQVTAKVEEVQKQRDAEEVARKELETRVDKAQARKEALEKRRKASEARKKEREAQARAARSGEGKQ